METLFRFNVVREAHKSEDEADPIDLTSNSQFQTSAGAIPDGTTRKAQLKTLATTYVASQNFISSVSADSDLKLLDEIAASVDSLIDKNDFRRTSLNTLFGLVPGNPVGFINNITVQNKLSEVADSILAIKLLPDEHRRPIHRLASVIRAFNLIKMFVNDNSFPVDDKQLIRYQRRALKLPDAVLPKRKHQPSGSQPGTQTNTGTQLQELAKKHTLISNAIDELQAIPPAGYITSVQAGLPSILPPAAFRPFKLFESEQAVRLAGLKATVFSAGANLAASQPQPVSHIVAPPAVAVSIASLGSEQILSKKPGVEISSGGRIALMGRAAFQPIMAGTAGLRLTANSRNSVSQETQQVLSDLKLNLSDPIAQTIQALKAERRRLHEMSQSIVQPLTQKTWRKVGRMSLSIRASRFPEVLTMTPTKVFEIFPTLPTVTPVSSIPTTHADILPAGVMDLLVVRQQLKGYESSEISHIVNVLKSETTERIHRTRVETEITTTTETETTTTKEKDLETTDRFEMQRESERTMDEQTSAKGSLMVKGKYGPSIEFQASGEVSWQRKTQQTDRFASETAREVTQKASEKVTERVLRREMMRINRQVEETNRHAFDNSVANSNNISGVYQWVTKVYEAQIYNYGPRTVYDIMIPEPAAFLLEAFQQKRTSALEIQKPTPFEITPDQLTEDNYQGYLIMYQATDIRPAPEEFMTETYDFNTGGEDEDQEFTNSTRIKIPEGYCAIRASVGAVVAVWDDWSVDVVIGQKSHRFADGNWVWFGDLDKETGSIPFAMVTDKVGDVAIAIEVICQATERARDLWRADTHSKLINAYRARMSEFEAKLGELESQAPPEIMSGPSQQNLAITRDEIKRACISVLTEQNFDAFNAVQPGTNQLPEINFPENLLEGSYVRFFEQSFEWENISWVTYPYFWGRKSGWLDKVVIEDDDPQFQAFLKAGYMRVQIPVRPGFVDALDHFRLYGEPWLGGSLPSISDSLYLPITEELTERLSRPGSEAPVGEPWEVRVPTSLVKLRPDDKLPAWQKQLDGTWKEA
jgi:hypothetical protein